MGQSVSFRDAAHMPSDEKQKEEWEKKYHWEEPHLWDYPMLPTKMTEASCAKCHKQQVYVPKADKLNVAYATYERAGCYACHKTQGLRDQHAEAGADPDQDRLEADAGLGEDLDPQSARGEADDLDAALLVQLEQQLAGRRGRATRSRSTRSSRICSRTPRSTSSRSRTRRAATRRAASRSSSRSAVRAATSSAKATRDEAGPRRTFGQPLENIGNKTTYEWIYNWVRDPKHYSPATYMPNLRLTDAQVADVATYLVDAEGRRRRRGEGARPIRRRSTTCCSTT